VFALALLLFDDAGVLGWMLMLTLMLMIFALN
jgi:hypothetical protein